jgi:predicted amidohydrolase YtcJ
LPMKIDPMKLKDIKADETVKEGKTIHEKGS